MVKNYKPQYDFKKSYEYFDHITSIAFKKSLRDLSTKESATFKYSAITTLIGVLCMKVNSYIHFNKIYLVKYLRNI